MTFVAWLCALKSGSRRSSCSTARTTRSSTLSASSCGGDEDGPSPELEAKYADADRDPSILTQ